MCCLTCRQGCGGDCAQARCHHRQQIVLQRSLQAGEHQPSQQVSTSVSGACVKAAVIWLKPHCLHAVSVLTSLASCQVCIEALSCLTCGKCSISVSIHFLVSKFSSDVYFLIFPAWPSANTDCGFISKSKLELLLFFFSLVWFLFFFLVQAKMKSKPHWSCSLSRTMVVICILDVVGRKLKTNKRKLESYLRRRNNDGCLNSQQDKGNVISSCSDCSGSFVKL